MPTICKLNDATDCGSVIQLILEPVEGGRPFFIVGDHRPIRHFLTDWDAARRPLVIVADDRESLSLVEDASTSH